MSKFVTVKADDHSVLVANRHIKFPINWALINQGCTSQERLLGESWVQHQ